MDQQVKVFVARPDHQSLVPYGASLVKGKN